MAALYEEHGRSGGLNGSRSRMAPIAQMPASDPERCISVLVQMATPGHQTSVGTTALTHVRLRLWCRTTLKGPTSYLRPQCTQLTSLRGTAVAVLEHPKPALGGLLRSCIRVT
jgi:hypothetical protein